VIGEEVLVTINGQTAGKRTRSRVRESGPRFLLCAESEDGKRLLFKSIGRGFNGWLPRSEIRVHRLRGNENITD